MDRVVTLQEGCAEDVERLWVLVDEKRANGAVLLRRNVNKVVFALDLNPQLVEHEEERGHHAVGDALGVDDAILDCEFCIVNIGEDLFDDLVEVV